MSDDEADPELLALLAQSLGLNGRSTPPPPRIRVLQDAEYIYDNSTDVAIDMRGTKAAAISVYNLMQEKSYRAGTWSEHELHPQAKDESSVDFIFLMDLLNFSFWSEGSDPDDGFAVDWQGKRRTGYRSLVACIQRALAEGLPITTPQFWTNTAVCTDDVLRNVFRSDTATSIPLLEDRIQCMREAGNILKEKFDGRFSTCIKHSAGSAAALVNLLVEYFPSFDDRHHFEDRAVCLYKRAQILVADLWACFEGESYGSFSDIDQITMFADYRIPQMLYGLSCISYSPALDSHVRQLKPIASGHKWELQIRGCSIWCVELLRREILRRNPDTHVNAILIDFFLYDTMKSIQGEGTESIPHHRTRSIWY